MNGKYHINGEVNLQFDYQVVKIYCICGFHHDMNLTNEM